MGSPLDDLRKISNQVEKKKKENIKNRQAHQQLEKEMLSEGSLEHQKRRQDQSVAIVKRGEKIKLFAITISFLIVASLIFFIVKFVIFGASVSSEKIGLVSDGFDTLDATNEEYTEVTSFINGFFDNYKKEPVKTEIPWYYRVPAGKKLRYKGVLDSRIKLPGLEFMRVKYNKETNLYQAWYENGEDTSLVFNLVDNGNLDLKIVKIF